MSGTWLPRDQYIATLPKATAYACMYFTDTTGRPFQLRSTRPTEVWQHAGGNMDPGESPWETAVRECREETGLDVTAHRPTLLLTHFVTPRHDWPHPHIGFIFDGGILTPEQLESIVLDPHEHTEWSIRSIDEWEKEMKPPIFARLKAIDQARRSGIPGYLESDESREPLGSAEPGEPA
ncbi:MAG: NUDIX hydrolase [Streptomycetaceae bacterium]|nr:NUDIX hydrolase [Streptomycetaceae bacterium]